MIEVTSYNLYGAALSLIGATLTSISFYFLSNVALLVLGIGLIVLGLSILITPSEPIAKKEIRLLLEDSVLNLERVLEYLHARYKAFYYPLNSDVLAVIPLTSDKPPKKVQRDKFAFMEGKDLFITIKPPASILLRQFKASDLESALYEILVDRMEFCDSLKVIRGRNLVAELKKPRAHVGAARIRKVLGSIEGSITASVAALILGKPVRILNETEDGKTRRIVMEVIG